MSTQGELLSTIRDGRSTRDIVAMDYAWAYMTAGAFGIEWDRVAVEIVERWSLSGLKYIKHEAWKIIDANVAAVGGGGDEAPQA